MKKQTTIALKTATIGFLVLSIGVILFPIKKTPIAVPTTFVRNIQQLGASHGAADQWDYLFEEDTQVYGGQLGTATGTTTTTPTTPSTAPSSSLLNAMQQSFNQAIESNDTTYQGSFWPGKDTLPEDIIAPNDCTSPRGETVKHADFVLAYQQRTDVTSMCNIERRICNNGTLQGSYTQKSCKENIVYEYEKVQPVSYNEPVINPLIQWEEPSNAGGDFNTQGQLAADKKPTTMRWTTTTSTTTSNNGTSQTTDYKQSCLTPRGTQVNHGQFVKAYKSSVGLLDVPCETELRLCVDGTLKGNFTNKKCTFQDMTYNDYLAGNHDITTPTPQDIADTLTTDQAQFNLLDMIRSLFQ